MAEPAARLRADDPLSRPAVLAHAAGRERPERARLVRPLAGAPVPAVRRPVTFADVAGIDEAKAELTEVVDFLRHPEKYQKLGGRIPHGVLLSGPPGTGKTLLARAVAGEADVPFFSMAASEFVEAIVGVGASRVRDLFTQAKEAAPAIVFIDELDAIGRSRTSGVAGFSGGNDEREQTLNQILTEMDGFDSSTSVIVIGATNRPDVLDQALLRPGRFDRRVAVQPPDRAGREAILKVHTRRRAARRLTSTSAGSRRRRRAWSGRISRISSTRQRCWRPGGTTSVVDESDFTDALERIVLGAERQVMMSPEDRRRTAYHEAGHAIVGMLTDGADPVRKVSIIPRGTGARRHVRGARERPLQLPRARGPGEDQRRARRPRCGGGRVRRDEHRRGVGHPAAHRDRAPDGRPLGHELGDRPGRRDPARRRGPVPPRRRRGLGRTPSGSSTRRCAASSRSRTTQVIALLEENRGKLDSLAKALLEHETLDEDDAYAAAGVPRAATQGADSYSAAARSRTS